MRNTRIVKLFLLLKLVFVAAKQIGVEKLIILLSSTINRKEERLASDELEKVAGYIGIPAEVILTKTRKRHIVEAQQVAMFLAKRNTSESLAKIGVAIGRKDHTTVIHACKTVENLLDTDRNFRKKWLPLIIAQ